jgi:maleamate amidohydrolase
MEKSNTAAIYERARLGHRLHRGARPAVVVVDFTLGFTDPASPLGSDLDREVHATRTLLDAGRAKGLPIVFTIVAYQGNMNDLGIWAQKAPAMVELVLGSRWAEVDPHLDPRREETIITKKGASAFFGTNLGTVLVSQAADSIILCGATTSGCVRATAIDCLQHGFPTLVPRECVGDRAAAPHEANLIDIDAKYADVVSLAQALSYVDSLVPRQPESEQLQ